MFENKPPLGIMPEYIFETQRIQELTRALFEYTHNHPLEIKDFKYDLLMDWTQELFRRFEYLYNKNK